MGLLTSLLIHLPASSLHVLPTLIPEAVLGTKEPSEKARTAAFDFIVAMGQKMKEGGVIRRDKLNEMDDGSAKEGAKNNFRCLLFSACSPDYSQ